MNALDRAKEIILESEAKVRDLVAIALRERRYEEVEVLAQLAGRLASVVGEVAATDSDVVSENRANDDQQAAGSPAVSVQKRGRDQYPRFERRGDRLVKLGWSKKSRSEYEHRAPMDAVRAVAKHLISSADRNGYIRMEDVLPVILDDGSEVPSYQAYLVLAWLREMSAVSRHGNDGYKVRDRNLGDIAFSEMWEGTPKG